MRWNRTEEVNEIKILLLVVEEREGYRRELKFMMDLKAFFAYDSRSFVGPTLFEARVRLHT